MQIVGVVGGAEKLPDPTFSITATTCSGFTASITNYSGSNTYSATVSAGSVSVSTSTITVTGLSKGQSSTITLTVSRTNFESSSGTTSSSAYVACSSCNFAYSATEFCGCFSGIQWNYDVTFRTGSPGGCCPDDCPALIGSCYSTGSVGVC